MITCMADLSGWNDSKFIWTSIITDQVIWTDSQNLIQHQWKQGSSAGKEWFDFFFYKIIFNQLILYKELENII